MAGAPVLGVHGHSRKGRWCDELRDSFVVAVIAQANFPISITLANLGLSSLFDCAVCYRTEYGPSRMPESGHERGKARDNAARRGLSETKYCVSRRDDCKETARESASLMRALPPMQHRRLAGNQRSPKASSLATTGFRNDVSERHGRKAASRVSQAALCVTGRSLWPCPTLAAPRRSEQPSSSGKRIRVGKSRSSRCFGSSCLKDGWFERTGARSLLEPVDAIATQNEHAILRHIQPRYCCHVEAKDVPSQNAADAAMRDNHSVARDGTEPGHRPLH